MAQGGQGTLCRSCKISLHIPHSLAGSICLDDHFFDYIVGVKKGTKRKKQDKQKHKSQGDEAAELREDKLNEFYRSMNALINEGSGVVILHTEKTYRLQAFNEVVGSRLISLIPDDSLYHENFDINIYDDEHIVFRVKARERPISFYDFHTKLSLDKGLADFTHAQFYREIKRLKTLGTGSAEAATGMDRQEIVLSKDGDTFVCKLRRSSPGDAVHLIESVDIQAKCAPKDEDVVEWIWDDSKLPLYMTAFAKLPHGGTMYIGIAEEKDKADPNKKTGRCILDTQTAQSKWQRTISDQARQKEICKGIEKNIKDEVSFLSDGSDKLTFSCNNAQNTSIVQAGFHESPVCGAPNVWYVAVQVKPFGGLVFFESGGAEYYALNEQVGIQRKPFAAWPGLNKT